MIPDPTSSGTEISCPPAEKLIPIRCEIDTNHEYIAGQYAVFCFRLINQSPNPFPGGNFIAKSSCCDHTETIRRLFSGREQHLHFQTVLSTPGEAIVKVRIQSYDSEGDPISYRGDFFILIGEKSRHISSIAVNPTYNLAESRAAVVDGSIKVNLKDILGFDDRNRQAIRLNAFIWQEIILIQDDISPFPEPPPPGPDRLIFEYHVQDKLLKRFLLFAKPILKIGKARSINDILAWHYPIPAKLRKNDEDPTPNKFISREHAAIEFREDAVFLHDKKSIHMTFVNNHQVAADKPYRISDGDELDLAGAVKYKINIFCDRSPRTSFSLRKTLKIGDTGDDVEFLQKRLREAGLYKAAIDHIFGSLTEKAVRQFQRQKGIAEDGIAGPITFQELGISDVLGIHKMGPIDALRLLRIGNKPDIEEEYVLLIKEAKVGSKATNCISLVAKEFSDVDARVFFDRGNFYFQNLDPDRPYHQGSRPLICYESCMLNPGMEIKKGRIKFIVREFCHPEFET